MQKNVGESKLSNTVFVHIALVAYATRLFACVSEKMGKLKCYTG